MKVAARRATPHPPVRRPAAAPPMVRERDNAMPVRRTSGAARRPLAAAVRQSRPAVSGGASGNNRTSVMAVGWGGSPRSRDVPRRRRRQGEGQEEEGAKRGESETPPPSPLSPPPGRLPRSFLVIAIVIVVELTPADRLHLRATRSNAMEMTDGRPHDDFSFPSSSARNPLA